MKKRKKIILSSGIILMLLLVSGFFMRQSVVSWRLGQAASAAGALPYQVGLTNAIVIPCVTTGYPPICTGGTLCSAVDVADCTLYSDVNGMSAGGTGQPPLLLSKVAIVTAGLMEGGQLIYGGTTFSMLLSPNAVLASAGGCSGCMAKADPKDKIFNWLDKYIIAGFKKK